MNEAQRREEEVFEAALKLPFGERATYLDQTCAGDADFRRRVEVLLGAFERAGGFLKEPAFPTSIRTVPFFPPPTEKPGDRIGRYKLLEQIGEGGCGVVYVAEQEELVRRRVALKIIRLGMDTRQVIARFDAERQALAMMDHPNIAKIHDAGATETGRPYFVMELVRGVKITDYCEQNQLGPHERLDLFTKVCHAIQHAHQKGVIHRDIKPSNILVASNDGVPIPKVIDFGIAKATQGRLTDQTVYTAFEQFIGTPAYMSPEQAQLTMQDIDTRSDIYSLGVLLYELLTGTTPFDANELLSKGLDEMRRTIREVEPVKPSTRLTQDLAGADLSRLKSKSEIRDEKTEEKLRALSRRLLQEVRGDLDWIVMKCLEKDRSRRYETANGLASDINRHLNNEPIVARPPSKLYRFQKLVRRNKLVFAAGGCITAVLVIGILFSVWQALRATRAEGVARKAQASEARQRVAADDARHLAEAKELVAREQAYASDMNLAQQALAVNNVGRAEELLSRNHPSPGQRDLRGWEWRYLWQRCRSDDLFTLCQKKNAIYSLAASWDGRWLAVAEHLAGGLSIWDLRARQEIALLNEGGGGGNVHLAFSPHGPLLAFSGEIGWASTNGHYNVGLWDGASRQVIAKLPLNGPCAGLAFSGDGSTLVTATRSPENLLTLWRVPQGIKVVSYPAMNVQYGSGNPFALAGDLSVAVHATPGGRIRVIDLATGAERWSVKGAQEHITALALSPNGKVLASGAGYVESAIRLWDAGSGKELGRLEGHRAWTSALLFLPDGKTLISASADQTIRLWDVTSLQPLGTLHGHRSEVWSLALLPDGTTLVSGCKDGSVKVWDLGAIPRDRTPTLPAKVVAWRFSPDSQSVFTIGQNGLVMRWKGIEDRGCETLINLRTSPFAATISDDCRLAAIGSTNGIVQVWDLQGCAMLGQFEVCSGPVHPSEFLQKAKHLIVLTQRDQWLHEIHEWDITTWRETSAWRIPLVWNEARGSAVSWDERWCVTVGYQGEALVRDMATGLETNLHLHIREACDVAFSADNQFFAVASQIGFAKLWETGLRHEMATFGGFLLGAHSVTFAPDSKRLAVGSNGAEAIKLWDTESRQEVLTLEGQGSLFSSTAFSPDGNTIGSLNSQGVLHLWRAPTWEQIEGASN